MKIRESGMPEAEYWDSLFDVEVVLDRLEVTSKIRDLVEFGCGYGTFTIPAARRISGTLQALDMDDAAMKIAEDRVRVNGLRNVIFTRRDFVEYGTGLDDAAVDYAMVFNILHHDAPVELLREAHRVLRPGGAVGVIHWIHESATPRGPALDIRPRPEDLRRHLRAAGFVVDSERPIACPPWHYGLIGIKYIRKEPLRRKEG